eukprot:747297-Hanusia_phi.AAC.2
MLTEVFAPTKAAERLHLHTAGDLTSKIFTKSGLFPTELPLESKTRHPLKYDKETTKAFEREVIARRAALENKLSESSKSNHDKASKSILGLELNTFESFGCRAHETNRASGVGKAHDPKRSAGPQGIVQSSRIDRPIHISSDIAHTNDTAAAVGSVANVRRHLQ